MWQHIPYLCVINLKHKDMVSIITFIQRNSRTIAIIGGVSILGALIIYNAIKYGI
jgi:hypothetical protein